MKILGRDVEGVIFDFDGTLADSMWVWDEVDRAFFEKRGLVFTKDASEVIAVLGFEKGADYVVERFDLDESPEDIIEEWKRSAFDSYATQVKLKRGALEFIVKCKNAGLPLGIATSLQRHLLEAALRNRGALDMFDAICTCDELECNGKSTPTVYLEAARIMGVDLERCAVFEDVVTAATSAKGAGAFVVGVYDEHKQQATEDLRAVSDAFIESWQELL